jgi:hypothetical protein
MPWEISVVHEAEGLPLGDKQSVCAWVSEVLPGVDLRRPPLPPQEVLDAFPPPVREAFLRPKLEALYEGNDFFIEFYCTDAPEIRCLHADVRGSGNPVPILARLCGPKGWAVVSAADGSRVDLSTGAASQWQHFCAWRDRAIRQIQDSPRG